MLGGSLRITLTVPLTAINDKKNTLCLYLGRADFNAQSVFSRAQQNSGVYVQGMCYPALFINIFIVKTGKTRVSLKDILTLTKFCSVRRVLLGHFWVHSDFNI